MDYSIYVFRSPQKYRRVRYVGLSMSLGARRGSHSTLKGNNISPMKIWLRMLREIELKPSMEIIEELSHDDPAEAAALADAAETKWIQHFNAESELSLLNVMKGDRCICINQSLCSLYELQFQFPPLNSRTVPRTPRQRRQQLVAKAIKGIESTYPRLRITNRD